MMPLDEYWEGDMRASRVLTRYEVGTDKTGLELAVPSRARAFEEALAIANRWDVVVTVADTMARAGCGKTWEIHPGHFKPGSCPVLPPATRRGASPAGKGGDRE